MEYQEAIDIIKGKSGLYEITTSQGSERKRLFLSQSNHVCEFAPRSRKRGYPVGVNIVSGWLCLSPAKPKETNPVLKFKRYAARATFPSAFIRKCLAADPSKGCYENHLTTGTRIDGEIISLEAIGKYAPWAVNEFRKALSERRNYTSGRFDFRGYDGSLWLTVIDKDDNYYRKSDIAAGFSKEYRNCGNGYYYTLIDDEHFIGTDID